MSDEPVRLDIFHTALPMRQFEHAAATRRVAEAVVVRLRTAAGGDGWGETLPRPYVTGETIESVCADIENVFWPPLAGCRTAQEAAREVSQLPCRLDGRVVTAARCAVELAAVQAYRLPIGPGASGPAVPPAVTGVLGSSKPGKTARTLRLMRWYGLRSFKLKLGLGEEIDRANLRVVARQLGRALKGGKASLRVDVNGAWPYGEVVDRVRELKAHGVLAVEQPCQAGAARLAELALKCPLPLIADESALTEDEVEVLLGAEGRAWLNLRLAKNGGFGPVNRLARLARRDGVPFVLGCMVGESGILSLAQRALLAAGLAPTMVEGNYGQFLLKDDLLTPSPRFGYAGRLHRMPARYAPAPRGDRLRQYGRLVASLPR